jgi:hypothetical protein
MLKDLQAPMLQHAPGAEGRRFRRRVWLRAMVFTILLQFYRAALCQEPVMVLHN